MPKHLKQPLTRKPLCIKQGAELLTVAQVAAWLNTTGKTIYAMVRAGKLAAPVRVGPNGGQSRWRTADIEAYLGGQGNAGNEPTTGAASDSRDTVMAL